MDNIIIILGSLSLMWVLINFLEIIALRYDKPIIMEYACLYCYSFWFTLVVLLFKGNILEAFYIASITALAAYLIDLHVLKKND